jgi:hypothetical protein
MHAHYVACAAHEQYVACAALAVANSANSQNVAHAHAQDVVRQVEEE